METNAMKLPVFVLILMPEKQLDPADRQLLLHTMQWLQWWHVIIPCSVSVSTL